MKQFMPNGQDIIDDAYENARHASQLVGWKTFEEFQKSSLYVIGRSRAEVLYGRGDEYDISSRQGWIEGSAR